MKYSIFEHWQNRANTGTELYAKCNDENNVREILDALTEKFEKEGLGKDFPALSEGYELNFEFHDNILTFWLDKDEENYLTEHRRTFQVVINRPAKWDFQYEEEFPDTTGQNEMGVISDGEHYLFYHAYAHDEGEPEICHIYDSITMQPESTVCAYPWTAENDSILLNALNSLENPTDYCGEGSPIMSLQFHKTEN